MLYIGLDLSLTATGIAVLDEKVKLLNSGILTSKKRDTERLLDLERQLEKFICNYIPTKMIKIFIENYSYGSKIGQSFNIGEWGGVVRTLLKRNKYDYTLIAPTSLKKFVTGKGNAKKELMMLEVFKKWGESFNNNNLADAYSLARLAWSTEHQKGLLNYEKEVIKVVIK